MKIPWILLTLGSLAVVSCDRETTAAASPESTAEKTTASSADATYPIDTCVVSGKKLGSMGEPAVITYEGTQVKFCCSGCEPAFRKEPEKYLSKLK